MKYIYYAIWVIQVLSIATILVCAWQVLDRPTFGIVAAAFALAGSVLAEWRLGGE